MAQASVYLLFFCHSFDTYDPDLLGVFDSKEELFLIAREKSEILKKWKGKFFFVEQKKNVLFLHRHPANTESEDAFLRFDE